MSISKFLILFRLFCLAPKITNSPLISVFLSIYSLLSVFGIVTLLTYTFALSNALTDDSLVVVVCALLTLNVFITDLVVVTTAFQGRDKLIHILSHLEAIDKLFIDQFQHIDLASRTIQPRYVKKYLLIILCICLSYLLCLISDRSLDVVLALHPLLIIRSRSVQILFFVDLIGARLTLLIDDLESVAHIYNTSNWDATTQEVSYQKIATLKSLYGELWSLTVEVNECFGWSLLFLSVENIAELIINSYITFTAFFTMDVISNIWQQSVLGTLPALITFLVTCHTCHHCSDKVEIFTSSITILTFIQCFMLAGESNNTSTAPCRVNT